MGKIASIEYFRVPPRWLFVKITDEDGNFGWGEASLEGHTQAVEGCLDAWAERYVGLEAEYVKKYIHPRLLRSHPAVILNIYGKCHGEHPSIAADQSS
jgi:L-alanine-DL-glutamate epimerase-like enolase superfamily enzyme